MSLRFWKKTRVLYQHPSQAIATERTCIVVCGVIASDGSYPSDHAVLCPRRKVTCRYIARASNMSRSSALPYSSRKNSSKRPIKQTPQAAHPCVFLVQGTYVCTVASRDGDGAIMCEQTGIPTTIAWQRTVVIYPGNSLGSFALPGLRCPQALDFGPVGGKQASQFALHSSHLHFPGSDSFQRVLRRSGLVWVSCSLLRRFQPVACSSRRSLKRNCTVLRRSRHDTGPPRWFPENLRHGVEVLTSLFGRHHTVPTRVLAFCMSWNLHVPRTTYTPAFVVLRVSM